MKLTKNKLLILIWCWSLLCIAFTVWITFGTQVQNGFLETLPSFVVIGLWTAIPILLIVDYFVPKVFWVLAVGGSPCLILSLIGTFCLIGSKNWKVILLYIFFVFSLIPHLVAVFFMRKYYKKFKKELQRDEEEARLAVERRGQRVEMEKLKLRNQKELEMEQMRHELDLENQRDQVLSLMEKQEAERELLKATLGAKSARKGGRR